MIRILGQASFLTHHLSIACSGPLSHQLNPSGDSKRLRGCSDLKHTNLSRLSASTAEGFLCLPLSLVCAYSPLPSPLRSWLDEEGAGTEAPAGAGSLPGPHAASSAEAAPHQHQDQAGGEAPLAGVPPQQVLAAQKKTANWKYYGVAGAAVAGVITALGMNSVRQDEPQAEEITLTNWSGTHECRTQRFFEPESVEELEKVVAEAHEQGKKLRCVGSALSPNGIAFCEEGMVSVGLLDKVLEVYPNTGQVRLQAGARVADVVEQLRPHGLTLQNFASIREQSIGGFVQVSAHGTGPTLPPVDEQVVAMTLVTPGEGTLALSLEKDPELFKMARVGLGCLGVLAEVTLQCVPAHHLLEHTFVSTYKEVKRKHKKWLAQNRHLRYMWIPYTDTVVVVTNNPVPEGTEPPRIRANWTEEERRGPLRSLLETSHPLQSEEARSEVSELSGTQLRDRLIALDPLNPAWIAQVNQAEAAYWKRSEGYRVGWSDQILGFDCGGQQLVLEVAFPTGSLRRPSGADLAFMRDTLDLVEQEGVPAPAPIEQRWTASSSSPMSPAASRPGVPPETVHSWVGIIHYLPTDDPATRQAITDSFNRYYKLVQQHVMPRFDATEHWAKIEVGNQDPEAMVRRLAERFPVSHFNALRRRLDPKNILANPATKAMFPLGVEGEEQKVRGSFGV